MRTCSERRDHPSSKVIWGIVICSLGLGVVAALTGTWLIVLAMAMSILGQLLGWRQRRHDQKRRA